MANMTSTVTASITGTEDTSGNVIINRNIGNSFDMSSVGITEYRSLGAGVNTVGISPSPATVFYAKNIDPAKSITVNWIPNGGINAAIIVLNPGDMILFSCNPAGATTPGITQVTFTPSAANCLVEFYIGG